MQLTGKIVLWRNEKGFGFLLCNQTGQEYFFHIRDFTDIQRRPQTGDSLNFQLGQDPKGRAIATRLSFTEQQSHKPQHRSLINTSLYTAKQAALYFRYTYFALVIVALLYGQLIWVLPFLYIEASLFTYWLYEADKAAAIDQHGNRLAEESLQLFSLIGGWPGALVAQHKLPHKRNKPLFQREFRLVILANLLLTGWLLSAYGRDILQQLALLH